MTDWGRRARSTDRLDRVLAVGLVLAAGGGMMLAVRAVGVVVGLALSLGVAILILAGLIIERTVRGR